MDGWSEEHHSDIFCNPEQSGATTQHNPYNYSWSCSDTDTNIGKYRQRCRIGISETLISLLSPEGKLKSSPTH